MPFKSFIFSFLFIFISLFEISAEIDISRLRPYFWVSTVKTSDIDYLQAASHNIPQLKRLAQEAYLHTSLSLPTQIEAARGVLDYMEDKGMQDSEDYRLTIQYCLAGSILSLDYEKVEYYKQIYRENIERYVLDSERKKLWQLFVDLNDFWKLMVAPEWQFSNKLKEVLNLWEASRVGNDELAFYLGLSLLDGASNGLLYIEGLDKIYDELKRMAANIWPGMTEAVIEIEQRYLRVKLAQDSHDFISRIKLETIRDNHPEGYIRTSLSNELAMVYYKNGDKDKALSCLESAVNKLDSLSMNWPNHSIDFFKASMLSSLILCDYYVNGNTSLNHRLNDIYAELKSGVSITQRRFWGIVLSDVLTINDKNIDRDKILVHCLEIARKEVCAPAAIVQMISLQSSILRMGRGDEAVALGHSIHDMIEENHLQDRFMASHLQSMSDIESSFGQHDKAVEYLLRALPYLNTSDSLEHLLEIYCSLAFNYQKYGESQKSSLYAEKYWQLRPQSYWPVYEHINDYYIQRIRSFAIKDFNLYVREIRNLKNRAKRIGAYDIVALFATDLGKSYAEQGLPQTQTKARKEFEEAFSYLVDIGDFNQLVDFATVYLFYLDAWGDIHRHGQIVADIISDFERPQNNFSLTLLMFIGNEISYSINNGNFEGALYYVSKLISVIKNCRQLCGDDQRTISLALGVAIPNLINYATAGVRIYKSLSSEKAEIFLKNSGLEDVDYDNIIEESQKLYATNISTTDENYSNILISKAKWDIANGRYDRASRILDSIAVMPQYCAFKGEVRDFAPQIRLDIAQARGDMDEVARLLELDEVKNIFNYTASGEYNISSLSGLYLAYINSLCQRGDYTRAMEIARKRYGSVRQYIINQYASLTQGDRTGLVDIGIASSNDINSILPFVNTPNNRILAYDASLFYRNIILESNNMQRKVIYAYGDSALCADYERLLFLKNKMKYFHYDSSNTLEYASKHLSLVEEAHQLELSIFDRCPSINELSLSRNVNCKKISKALASSDAAIEFISYYDMQKKKWRYGALVLRRGDKSPQFVSLLYQDDLDQFMVLQKKSSNITNAVNRTYAYPKKGCELYTKLWQPLEVYLGGVERIFFAPVGSLNTIAFGALEDSSRTTLCQRYELRLVSSTAQVLKSEMKYHDKMQIALLGGVTYDNNPEVADRRRGEWEYLPGSIKEITLIDSIAADIPTISSTMVIKDDASEKWLRGQSGNAPDIMHLSTHGFYFDGKSASHKSFMVNKGLTNDTVPNEAISPLLRGGVILADANTVWNNEGILADEIDGVVTAAEISELDFSNTHLMVLSACDTGLGETTITEGVNGLQRGFKLSGVGSIIMSLWLVNDVAGAKFMQRFYTHLLREGQNRYEAFRNTQLELLQEYPRQPFYWAPFVMLD